MTLTLNGDNQVLQHSHYQPYGDAANLQLSALQPYGFSGKERDDSGLLYFEARYYDPLSGRFISPDPLFGEQMDKCLSSVIECNLYQYTGNNPVNYVDPTGEAFFLYPLAVFVVKELAAEAASQATGGATDFLSVRRLGTKAAKFAKNKLSDGVQKANKDIARTKSKPEVDDVTNNAKTYQTYTKTNPKTGEVYTGRTSGTGTPEQNIARRDANHHMNDKGFGPAVLDKSSANRHAVRGREQQLIQANGGAKSMGGTSGNAINGVSPLNPRGPKYRLEAFREFDE
ncbi:RHS repeat-associated core domain-containing protein [Bacterioplanoides sp.]|uniref:RHS repeat-associated core domain-containing protein n=1 Tax=Bacterioplanoides sp. TaxID=2066072 RepID=UPI003AFF97DE